MMNLLQNKAYYCTNTHAPYDSIVNKTQFKVVLLFLHAVM